MDFEPALNFVRGLPPELTGAVVGALVGALIAGWWTSKVSKGQMRHHRRLALDTGRWATATSTIKEMLDPLETMNELLEHLCTWGPDGQRRSIKDRDNAKTALDIMYRLNRTHAPLLPKELADRWSWATDLARAYRAACQQGASEGWTTELLGHARDTVRRYMAWVNRSLATYVQTGDVSPGCVPPRLRIGTNFEQWLPPADPRVGTRWERTRSKLANWRGTT